MNSPKLPGGGPSKLPPTATSLSEKCVGRAFMNDFGSLIEPNWIPHVARLDTACCQIGYRMLPGQMSAPAVIDPKTLNVARPVLVGTNREWSAGVPVDGEAIPPSELVRHRW